MLKKLLTLSVLLIFSSGVLLAQSHVLKADGSLTKLKKGNNLKEVLDASKLTGLDGRTITNNVVLKGTLDPQGTLDTLHYVDRNFGSNFGFFGQDQMFQYFVAPADLVINGAAFSCSDADGSANATVSMRILKLNWTWDELVNVPAPLHMGYYPNSDGLGNVDPFGEDATGEWQDSTGGVYPTPPWAHDDYDVWSDFGFGWPVTAELQDEEGNYQWVDMSNLGVNPEIAQGEVFAILMSHDGTTLDGDRIGFYADNTVGIPAWKFYENGRFAPGDGVGWWARAFTWDFAVAVDLVGDRAPAISGVSRLLTTVDTGPQTVEATIVDDNPSGGASGVASASLWYSLDTGATYTEVAMADQGGDVWAGDIPGQEPGTLIMYKVSASDVEGGVTESGAQNYSIFQVVNTNLLVIFNGGSEARAAQLDGFYLQGLIPMWDLWGGYGPVGEFINQYDAVLEIHSEGGPADDNQAALAAYAAQGGVSLGVIGQEALGYLVGYADSAYVAGDYEYEILGVMQSYNDINYAAAGDETLPSQVIPQAGTMLGDSLAMWLAGDVGDTLWYWPDDILGASNWMDQFDPREDLDNHEVFLHGIAVDGTERPVGHNYTHAVGTEIMFMSCDPISFETDSAWIGNSTLTPLAQFLQKNVVSVRLTDDTIPQEFELSQNYPNPFNPTTTINFSVPNSGLTTLKVYNVLGQEVATLLDKDLKAGSYSFDFDASQLSSGMYIYSIKSGNVEVSKKMMLLK